MHLLNATVLLKLSFGPNLVRKTKTSIIYEISRMLFSNTDFTLMHFTNFNFPSFELSITRTIFFSIIRAFEHQQFEHYGITRVISSKWFLVTTVLKYINDGRRVSYIS